MLICGDNFNKDAFPDAGCNGASKWKAEFKRILKLLYFYKISFVSYNVENKVQPASKTQLVAISNFSVVKPDKQKFLKLTVLKRSCIF